MVKHGKAKHDMRMDRNLLYHSWMDHLFANYFGAQDTRVLAGFGSPHKHVRPHWETRSNLTLHWSLRWLETRNHANPWLYHGFPACTSKFLEFPSFFFAIFFGGSRVDSWALADLTRFIQSIFLNLPRGAAQVPAWWFPFWGPVTTQNPTEATEASLRLP